MSKLIPQDIEGFLCDLGTRRDGIPGAFEEYAKTAAALLWEKYCILEDPSIQIMPCLTGLPPFSAYKSYSASRSRSGGKVKNGSIVFQAGGACVFSTACLRGEL